MSAGNANVGRLLMNTLPDPKEVTTTQAAEILLAHGWEVYPNALPYGEFFYVPVKKEGWSFEVACLAYREFYAQQQRAQQSMHLTAFGDQQPASYPLQLPLFADDLAATIGGR